MKKYGVVIVVSLAVFILTLDTTMMNVAITALAQDLDTSIQNIQLAIALYALVMAACMITGAKLANIYGTKRIFLIGVVIYGVGTLTAALSVNVGMLIAGWSIIEGVGSAFMMPAAATFLMVSYQNRERMIAFAVFSAVAVGGAAVGPIFGGVFTTYASWRWAFALESVVVAAILGFSFVLRGQRKAEKQGLDWVGVVLSASGMGCLVYGLVLTADHGWWHAKEPFTIGGWDIAPFGVSFAAVLMTTGLVFLLLLVAWLVRQERKGKDTLAPTSLLKNRPYMAGTMIFLAIQFCVAALLFTIPFFLQTVLFKNAIQTGILIMPLTLAMVVFVFVTARLARRLPIKYLIMFGGVICSGGTILLALSFGTDMSATDLLPGLIVLGVGLGFAYSQLQNLTLSSAEEEITDEASGLTNSFRNLGTSFGTAVVVSLMLTFLVSSMVSGIGHSKILPQEQKDQLEELLTRVVHDMDRQELEEIVKEIMGEYPEEYIEELELISARAVQDSMEDSYYVIAGVFGATLAGCFLLPSRKLVSTQNGRAQPGGGDEEGAGPPASVEQGCESDGAGQQSV